MVYKKSLFYIDGLGEENIEGYTNGETWNGHACPYFTEENALKVLHLADTVGGAEKTHFDKEKEVMIIVQDSTDPDLNETFESSIIEVDGEKITVYAIGAFSWIWTEVED